MKINRAAAIIGSVAAVMCVSGSVAWSSSSTPAVRHVSQHTAAAPANCVTTATTPDTVEKCGQCTRVTFPTRAVRAQAVNLIARHSDGQWLAIGRNWIGGNDASNWFGAAACVSIFGGSITFVG